MSLILFASSFILATATHYKAGITCKAMVHILYTVFTDKLSQVVHEYWMGRLTPSMQARLLRFRHWQDAQRSLLGYALLLKACDVVGAAPGDLHQLRCTEFQKPYFPKGPYFNISHSGNIVVCAVSTSDVLGIDVEEIKPIPLNDFSDLFSKSEMCAIFNNEDDYRPFYRLWTQKEAFLKATGTGLSYPLNRVHVQQNVIQYEGSQWFLKEIALHSDYYCYLATSNPEVKPNLRQEFF